MSKEIKDSKQNVQEVVDKEQVKEIKDINKVFEDVENNETFEERKYNNYSKNIKTKNSNLVVILLIVISSITILIAIFSTSFALFNISNTNIIDGISIKGINIGGLSKEEAKQKVEADINNQLSLDINLKYEEYETSINPAQIEFNYDIDSAIDAAYNIGRDGNIIENNYSILKTLINKKNIDLEFNYNTDNLNSLISDMDINLPNAIKQYSYYVEDGKLIITRGKEGNVIKKEELADEIIDKIQKVNQDEKNIVIPVELKSPDDIDIEKIHSEVFTEPKDAYYTTDPFTIYPHVEGVDFNMDEAKAMLQEVKDEYTINLQYTDPEITTNKIGTEAFPNLLSSFSTKYDASNKDRSTNLKLAMDKINGVVLMPGEEFSYNKVVGERTISAGYKEAKIYSNGKVIDGLGGGICQISTTLYDAVLYANLEVTSRRNHQFVTSYVKAGLDATVVYGSTDFKFKNSRSYPIKIVGEVDGGVAKIDIYGVKEETEYEVKLEPVVINYIPYTTKTIKDSSLPKGKTVVEQSGSNGVKTVTYKYLLLNGKVVSKTVLSNDTYNPMQRIIRVGS